MTHEEIRVQYVTSTSLNQVDPKTLDVDEVVHYSIPAIQDTEAPAIEDPETIESNKLLLRGNEVLISRLNPHKNCTAAVKPDPQGRHLLASTEFVPLTPNDVDGSFLRYFFSSQLVVQSLAAKSSSATRSHSRVDRSDIIKTKMPAVPIVVQEHIVRFLDREIKELNLLVAKKRRLIQLLEEKQQAIVAKAITRGLHESVAFQPSSLKWVGRIPANWVEPRFKQIIKIRDDRSESGEEELLTVSHITGVTPRSEKKVYMFKAEDMTGYKKCCEGDLVVNTLWAFMGALGVAWQRGIVSPDYHVYELSEALLPKYVDLVCRSELFKVQILRHSKGVWSSRLRLYPEEMLGMRFPFPPRGEQQDIVDYLEQTFRTDSLLIAQLEKSILLLEERRSALVTAAVSGEISVEEMSA